MTSQDEADQKYENVICMSMRGLSLFLRNYLPPLNNDTTKQPIKSVERLEKMFNDPKFWKHSKSQSNKVIFIIKFYYHNKKK